MANAGYDAVVVDMQHGMGITPDKAIACLQAISTTETVPIVRVPWNDPKEIQYVLDAGAYGIIVPLVNTYEEAAQAGGATVAIRRRGTAAWAPTARYSTAAPTTASWPTTRSYCW